MIKDKSLFYYGTIYHKLFDPHLAEARQITLDLIDNGSTVLDIGCGTGQLCIALREQKQCQVIGLDLSLRMLEFSRNSNPFQDVSFVHKDAVDLSSYEDNSFDYATMLMFVHELTKSQQIHVLKESLRVARKLIVVDAAVPLPKNKGGIGIRFVEATFGRDHYKNFKNFLATGGIHGMFSEFSLPIKVERSTIFLEGCREAKMVSIQK